MKEIKDKIQKLLAINAELKSSNFNWEQHSAVMKRQEEIFEELTTLARANNTLLGRMMKFPMADSYAMYVITKINTKTVHLKWVNYCDGWVDDRLGIEGTLDRSYAQNTITHEDRWKEMVKEIREAKAKTI